MNHHCKKPSPKAVEEQKKLLSRVKRIEGQVRGIHRMVDEEEYCDDIINQITATRAALREVQVLLLESHIETCVKDQMIAGEDDVVPELIKTVRRMVK